MKAKLGVVARRMLNAIVQNLEPAKMSSRSRPVCAAADLATRACPVRDEGAQFGHESFRVGLQR